MSGSLRLSVLDQSPIAAGSTGAAALANTLDLARLADRLGFHRYWVSEHHGGPMIAGASPEVLIAAIASVTSAMRIGSGGVMLPHYSPLKVAENFSVLSGLFPGRVDLALGRAAGTDPLTTYALQRDRREPSPDDFPTQLAELLAYLEDRLPAGHPFARLAGFLPGLPYSPEPWLLGSSLQSAMWAAELGLPYAFADFINPRGASMAARYRETFVDSVRLAAPQTAVGVSVVCAPSREEAEHVAASQRMAIIKLRQGELIAIPSPQDAQDFLAVEGDIEGSAGRRVVLGEPEVVREALESVAREYRADEVIAVTIAYDHEARRRSYELLADVFGLSRREVGEA